MRKGASASIAKNAATRPLPRRFVRAEVLSAFANSCYLLFLAFTQCTDALSASLVRLVQTQRRANADADMATGQPLALSLRSTSCLAS